MEKEVNCNATSSTVNPEWSTSIVKVYLSQVRDISKEKFEIEPHPSQKNTS